MAGAAGKMVGALRLPTLQTTNNRFQCRAGKPAHPPGLHQVGALRLPALQNHEQPLPSRAGKPAHPPLTSGGCASLTHPTKPTKNHFLVGRVSLRTRHLPITAGWFALRLPPAPPYSRYGEPRRSASTRAPVSQRPSAPALRSRPRSLIRAAGYS